VFERFTSDARDAVIGAQANARRRGARRIGTEHLLLALTAAGTPVAEVLAAHGLRPEVLDHRLDALAGTPPHERDRAALASLGIDLDRVRDAVESAFGPDALTDPGGHRRRRLPLPRRRRRTGGGAGRTPSGHIPFSRSAKKALELSLREAMGLGHRHIGAEHVALGLVREGAGSAAAALDRVGVDRHRLRSDLAAVAERPAA
jgi:ATP-dependent Clp protease ATP-binding subunit ClpA